MAMSEEQTITIEVDGNQLPAKPGQMLIEVTDAAGITVPRFCYHKNLSISANCRMCLVEVENAPKPLPACATPCADGMKVFTKSPLARAAQKGTMEFLLINHPLDCPICDQGGECELQDVAIGYGNDVSRFAENKRVVADPDIGPLVATEMTRCIHCTRCVRFGDEIAGLRELGATGRGEHTKIGTYVKHAMTSELSGNVIDLCPVGALTSKPFRYTARAWEMTQQETIAPHDSVGSNLYAHVRRGKVMRIVPRENDAINQSWISDRDRFGYEGLDHEERLTQPMVREGGSLKTVSWDDALTKAAESLAKVKTQPDEVMTLVSPSATLEEMYLAQKLVRDMGSNNIDHRLRQIDFRGDSADPQVSWLGVTLDDLENSDAVLLVGSNVRKEQPMINHRLRLAAYRGASVMSINPLSTNANYTAGPSLVVKPSEMVKTLQALASAVGAGDEDMPVSDEIRAIAENLRSAADAVVLLGNIAVSHPDYSIVRDTAARVAEATGCALGIIPEAANSVGAWIAGAVPNRLPGGKPVSASGRSVNEMMTPPPQCALLIGVEPMADVARGRALVNSLRGTESVIAVSAYMSDALMEVADVVLPMTPFSETSGTYVNAQRDMQSFNGLVKPKGESRPGWKILRVLGNFLDLEGFDYESSEDVCNELIQQCDDSLPEMKVGQSGASESKTEAGGVEATPYVPAYSVDAVVRRSEPLQSTEDARCVFRMHPQTASAHGLSDGNWAILKQGENHCSAKVVTDDELCEDVLVYASQSGDLIWGNSMIEKADTGVIV